jgi:signal peptidase
MAISVRAGYHRYLVLGLLITIYCLINLALVHLPISGSAQSYIVQPILWGLLSWAILMLPKYRPVAKLKLRSTLIQLALFIGFFQVVIYFISGLFSGFGESPYSFTPLGILTNLIFVISMLIGMELSRAWLINHLGKRHTFLALAFVSLLYTLLSIPLTQITSIRPELESINFLNSTLLPSLTENLLASLLALLAGPLAAIAYRGTLEAFWWFCPILPDLPWAFKGLIGVATPLIGMAAVNSFYSAKDNRGQPRRRAKEGFPIGWITTTIISVVIIWFSVGLFPFHPSLVASGSMQPVMYAGDIVIIAKIPADVVKEGDIIQFRKEEKVTVMHRVIEIQETEGAKFFITKGDANDEPDKDQVIPENVVGKHVLTVPKIGWVAIVIKSFFTG